MELSPQGTEGATGSHSRLKSKGQKEGYPNPSQREGKGRGELTILTTGQKSKRRRDLSNYN